ncbi:MAG: fused MFS/spermidine synthase [Mobilicoccus sp.]|nr:fused MFS/spermidine synthase [Mobilicoccus sp.]
MTDATIRHEAARGIGDLAGAALVFFSSAAVLVVELVALRLLAPHLGLTLETNTLVIGIALVAIAAGSWAGGRAADRIDPRLALAPLLAVSAVAVALTPMLVRTAAASGDRGLLLLVAAATIIVPGALLSAVTPMVTKLRLTSLAATGTVVGRLSGISTLGAIVGTVITGFVLISAVPVSGILVGLGIALFVAAVSVALAVHRRHRPARSATAGCAALVVVAGLGSLTLPDGCDVETRYHCAAVVPDPANPSGRTLILDGLRHSYVDLDDPTHLEFTYVRSLVSAIDATFPVGEALTAHHIGAGALTVPHYLDVTRPGTTSTVSEIDPGVIRIDTERLGARLDGGIDVRIEDGRRGLARVPTGSQDLVVGDAFGGVSVPWHLTTHETVEQIHASLRPDGLYALNVIDRGPVAFARAQVATLHTAFEHVAVAAAPDTLAGTGGGNLIVLASDAPLATERWEQGMAERDVSWSVVEGAELVAWVGDAPVLTDDYAPVDQLLTPY